MDFPTAPAVEEAIIQRAKHNVYGYNVTDDLLHQSIQQWLKKRHHWEIESDWISYSPGVVTSLHMIVQALTEEQDKILIQPPVYPPFYGAIEKHGRTVVKNHLQLHNGRYTIDFRDFEQKVMDKQVTMFILCSPHNPVGRVWEEEELRKMAELCSKHNVIIVSDEIHADLTYSNYTHRPISSLQKEIQENIVTCMAPSKTFNLAGLQASYIITPNKKWKAKIDKQFLSQGLHGLNTYGIIAMEAAYLEGEQWLNSLLQILEDNKNYVMESFQKHTDKIKVIEPEGTYLLWLDCRDLKLDNTALKQFFQTEAKVGLNDGASFGDDGEGFMRINIACPKPILEEGVTRILKALEKK
ncbi:MalY/PatB family protein [Salirhabdus sp. Marseille-P4669]|uniref:MalY/PatB family protein n=1 Tax=Salirhabdus sp. Marseille-P4669 TaxID=2042310 RepID=UPI0027962885|nr:MalY/PatB family protein [Salirhabdus sp. Marseille-P4669]